ncbi:MAG TPA: protein translocase subunit SecD, partial [Ktedonobacterales bacterium]|nr:protein translocase subunit SecD [Ktedonobacterales bacterium]
NPLSIKQGLDLQGGIQIVLLAHCPDNAKTCGTEIADNMGAVIDNVNRRVSGGLGLNDAVVRQQGSNRVSVELPGLKSDTQALALLGKTGLMEIIDTGATNLQVGTDVTGQTCTTTCSSGQYKVAFTGRQLDPSSIAAQLDPQSGQPIVTFAFKGAAKSAFAQYTQSHIGEYLTIILDNKVINSAVIQSEIDGNGQISGLGSITEAQNLASFMKYGALPLPLTVDSESQLAPTLGQQALTDSLRAAIIGLAMVMLFMLIYYRLPGLLADMALVLYAGILFAIFKILGVTLSLPSIAATILTIGMAVDANVLIFERIKEELRSGRTMSAAIDIGWKRAWPSIRDSNASTLITCIILYFFGSNFGATLIIGFAINLALGVLISLFTAVVVTRSFLDGLLLVPAFSAVTSHPGFYGLPRSALPIARYNRPVSRVAASRPGRAVPATVPAGVPDLDADEDVEDITDEDNLAPSGTITNGKTPTAARSGAAGSTGGAEE